MTTDVLGVAVAAIGVATETRAGESDAAALDLILDAVDEENLIVFVALLRTYQRQYELYGAEALQRSALAFARRACGLDP